MLRTEQQDGRHVGRSPDELGLEGGDRLVDDDDRGPRARHRRRGQCRRDAQELGGHGVRRGRRQRTTGVRRRPGAASVRLVRRQLYARPRRLCEAVILVLLERLVQRGQERLGEDRFDLLLGRRRGELPRHLRTDALLRLGEERLELRAEGRLDADRRPDGASGEGRFADPAGARGERPETGTTDRGPAVGMGERRSEGPTGHGCAEVDGPFDRGGPEGGGALGGLFEGPPVSASTLRTSACGSTGRAKNPLAAPEGSSENASSCGRSTPRNRMSSRAPPITLRAPATASAAPTASASTTITLGVCTATRAASSDSGTSTTR